MALRFAPLYLALGLLTPSVAPAHAHTADSGQGPGLSAAATAPAASRATSYERRTRGHRVTVLRHSHPGSAFDPAPDPPPAAATPDRRPLLVANCRPIVNRSDDAFNSPYSADTPVIKVIYAYPRDVGNRLERPVFPAYSPQTAADRIQENAKSMFDFVASESGQRESLRLDVGTAMGPDCLDIQTVALPRTAADYRAASPDPFHMIQADVRARLGDQPGIRNYLVYADGISAADDRSDETAGIAEQLASDSPDGSTSHNLGGLWAILLNFYEYNVALHEVTHTLGAVQPSAPHATRGNHCTDGHDVMCYPDGYAPLRIVCGEPYTEGIRAWDCNKDDYYNPSPPPGSYLATHWNLHNSVFMCPLAQCAPTDRTTPTIAIDRAPPSLTKKKTARFRFSTSEAARFRCAIDRRRRRCEVDPRTRYSLSASFMVRRLEPGRHRFRVWATDAAGNTAKARMSFKVAGGQ